MKTISVSFLVAGMLLPTVCLGQEGPPKSPPAGEKRRRAALQLSEKAWKLADGDRDGFISKEEFSAMPRVQKLSEEKRVNIFKRLDKNTDDRLSSEELNRIEKPQSGPPMQRLWELDTDKNGGISAEEFKAGQLFKKLPPEKREQVFLRLDSDGDGVITPQDKPEPPPKRPNFKKGPKPPEGFESSEPGKINRKLDLNGDDALSFEEFRKGANVKNLTEDQQEERFEKLDHNDDLKITDQDLPPPPPKPLPMEDR